MVSVFSKLSWDFNYGSRIVFHAYIFEHEQQVYTYPPLAVRLTNGSTLCHLHLLPTVSHNVPSFISTRVTDPIRGQGELILNSTALYEDRLRGDVTPDNSVYNLKIVAEGCGHPTLVSRSWSINLILVPTDYPVWSERQYTFTVPATLPPGDIVGKVTGYAAMDFGGSRGTYPLGDDTGMCGYAIDHPASSIFDINGHGVLRSRVRFDQAHLTRYEMNVTGFDCHAPVPRRSTVPVTVVVQLRCFPKWLDMDEQIVYPYLSHPRPISTSAKLEPCESDLQGTCNVSEVVSRIKLLWTENQISQLQKEDPSSICDLDLLSLRAQRHSCGISEDGIVELIPQDLSSFLPNSDNKGIRAEIHDFNGSRHWTVPSTLLPLDQHRLDNVPFTLTFWMNHSANAVAESRGRENLLCCADSEGKNRHHFAVFLHNCKLNILLRREPVNSPSQNHLYPSQWRFVLDEVCDNGWHHYALVYLPPPKQVVERRDNETDSWRIADQLKLYLDGELITQDSDSAGIAEDLPLRPLKRTSQTTHMSVGACWHSRTGRYVQHFTGQLAGLVLSRGVIEPNDRLQCLINCIPRIHLLSQRTDRSEKTDVSQLYRSSLSNLIVKADSLQEMGNLIQNVVYYNPRLQQRPESRPEPIGVQISTLTRFDNRCFSESSTEKVIQILHLPLLKQTMASLGLYSPTHPLRSTGSTSPSEPPTDTSYSLSLKIGGSPDGLQVTEVSENSLYQGVWIFPSADLNWKRSQTQNPRAIDHSDYASFCDVDLCENAGYLLLQQHEEVNISTEFLHHGLRLEKLNRVFRLAGPVRVDYMKTALQHLKWYNVHPTGMGGRCFQLHCVTELETTQRDGSVIQLKVKSNAVRSVIRIRHFMSGHTKPVTLNPVHKSQAIFPVPEPGYKQTAQRPQAFRVLRDLGPSLYSTDVPPKAGFSDSGQSFGYPLLIFAVTMVGILVIVVSIVVHSKLRSAHRLSEQEPEWEPVNADHVLRTTATKRCNSREHENLETNSKFADSLQLIVNPVSHPGEIEEMKNKFCFYDRKIYDGDPIDVLERVETSSDANEELSDFDGTADHGLSSLVEPLLDDRKIHSIK